MKIITNIAFLLTIIGALNWGMVGIFNFNLVSAIFGELTFLTRLIYILVFISGLWLIFDIFRAPDTLIKNK